MTLGVAIDPSSGTGGFLRESNIGRLATSSGEIPYGRRDFTSRSSGCCLGPIGQIMPHLRVRPSNGFPFVILALCATNVRVLLKPPFALRSGAFFLQGQRERPGAPLSAPSSPSGVPLPGTQRGLFRPRGDGCPAHRPALGPAGQSGACQCHGVV